MKPVWYMNPEGQFWHTEVYQNESALAIIHFLPYGAP